MQIDELDVFFTGQGADGENDLTLMTLEEIDSPITSLKEVVLSLDWEITAQTIERFQAEIAGLEQRWQREKILLAFLRILRALGNYIQVLQAATDPSVVQLLYTVYNDLEKVVLSPALAEKRKIELIQKHLTGYNYLKNRIGITPVPKGPAKAGAPAAAEGGEKPRLQAMAVQPHELPRVPPADARPGDDFVDLLVMGEGSRAAGAQAASPAGTNNDGEGGVVDIFDGLYKGSDFNVADDLLTDIHLQVFQEDILGAPAAGGHPNISRPQPKNRQRKEEMPKDSEIDGCLDIFFGGADEEENQDSGVVPLSSDNGEETLWPLETTESLLENLPPAGASCRLGQMASAITLPVPLEQLHALRHEAEAAAACLDGTDAVVMARLMATMTAAMLMTAAAIEEEPLAALRLLGREIERLAAAGGKDRKEAGTLPTIAQALSSFSLWQQHHLPALSTGDGDEAMHPGRKENIVLFPGGRTL